MRTFLFLLYFASSTTTYGDSGRIPEYDKFPPGTEFVYIGEQKILLPGDSSIVLYKESKDGGTCDYRAKKKTILKNGDKFKLRKIDAHNMDGGIYVIYIMSDETKIGCEFDHFDGGNDKDFKRLLKNSKIEVKMPESKKNESAHSIQRSDGAR